MSPEITARSDCWFPSRIVEDLNRFLRGWAGYFRYGNSARQFDKITPLRDDRLAVHRQAPQTGRRFGWRVVPTSHQPARADRPQRNHRRARPTGRGTGTLKPAVKNVGEPCAGEPHARIDGRRRKPGQSASRAARAPPADPTATAVGPARSLGPRRQSRAQTAVVGLSIVPGRVTAGSRGAAGSSILAMRSGYLDWPAPITSARVCLGWRSALELVDRAMKPLCAARVGSPTWAAAERHLGERRA